MPKVSIILTSFNHDTYIGESIDSVLGQTFTDFELIIWDDASTDGSWSVIESNSDPRIRAFRNEEHKRPIYGVIKAISEVAAGEYIAMHHSDDVWSSDKLEKQVAYLDGHPDIGAVFSDALAIGEDGLVLDDEHHFYSNIFAQPNRTRHEWLRFFFSHGNALCHPSMLIRKHCYEDCGIYRYGFAQIGDMDMWVRLCLKYDIHVLPEKLVSFRVRDNEANTSGNRPEVRVRAYFEYFQVLSNYLDIGSFDDLVQVFPESQQYFRGKDTVIEFALAMTVLDLKPFYFSILFALNVLFELITDDIAARRLADTYGFDYKAFIVLTGKHDPFQVMQFERLTNEASERDLEISGLKQTVSELSRTVSEQDLQIAELSRTVTEQDMQIDGFKLALAERDITIRAMHESHSWKLTAPLRAASRLVKKAP